MAEQTPVMKQYLGIKEQYPDSILLFRLGDFYEMFGDDARVASSILQIALTSRDKKKKDPLPMCGIPYFASENYIAKLVKAGHKVAVCEQTSDPRATKGIVDREVVRVITPGTHAPENPKENNYLMAFMPSKKIHGVAVADVSTGEFVLYETDRPVEDELTRYSPAEVVVPEGMLNDMHYQDILQEYYTSTVEDWKFDYPDAYKALLRAFKVASLEGFGCEGMNAAISAAGGLMAYLIDSKHDTLCFRKLSTLNQSTYMFLDTVTQRNLELTANLKDGTQEGTLLWALDVTETPMGGRFLRNAIMRPLLSVDEIQGRLDAVKYLVEGYEIMESLRVPMRNMQDLERLAQRVATGSATPRDLMAIRNSCELLPGIKTALSDAINMRLKAIGDTIGDFSALTDIVSRSIVDHPPATTKDGGYIKKGYSAEVDELRDISVNARDYIAELEAKEKKRTGINTLKVGYNRIHGYYIEVTKSNIDLVPDEYIRKQTLVGGERYITPELKDLEAKVLGAEDTLKSLELEIFHDLIEKAAREAASLMEAASLIAEIDYLISLAVVAKRHNYVMPRIVTHPQADIINGRHPVIEKLMSGEERFVPNDSHMNDTDYRLLLITGPNMAGKSTYMRQVALLMLMAQMGSFVPAESATIGVADRIFTRIGASDFLSKGQSTFMVEMVETANILNNATEQSLILLDEVGRGTSTFDGISIAWATAEYIAKHLRCRTLFATHYHELTELATKLRGIRNFNIVVKEWGEEIIFLRKIEQGIADKSYGIHVASLAGLPSEVLEKSREVLRHLEKQHIGAPSSYRQLDLFTKKYDVMLEEFMSIDTEKLTPEEIATKVAELQKKG
jgi:DNA mismatch repair protein MutS